MKKMLGIVEDGHLCQPGVHKTATGRGVVTHVKDVTKLRLIIVIILPVLRGQLQEPHWIWLNIDGEITNMHDCVDPGRPKDDPSNNLVEEDIVIHRDIGTQTKAAKQSQGVAEHHHQNKD